MMPREIETKWLYAEKYEQMLTSHAGRNTKNPPSSENARQIGQAMKNATI